MKAHSGANDGVIASAGVFLMWLHRGMFRPMGYWQLNRGETPPTDASSVMFWLGLLAGVIAQIVAVVLRKKQDRTFVRMYRHKQRKNGVNRFRQIFVKSWISIAAAAVFLIGLIGSTISLIQSVNSSYHTFFFLALTVLGLFEYFVFNSINYVYIRRSEEDAK